MRVLLLSRYGRLGASSRLRSLQYLPYVEAKGWQVDISPLFSDHYIQALYSGRPRLLTVLKGYWHRFNALLRLKSYDLIWIEYEIFPFMPALAERLLVKAGVPYIVDYDDALFHRYDKHRLWLVRTLLGRKIDTVMRQATLVVAGNEYLAERARLAGADRVEIIPTVVNLDRYSLLPRHASNTLVVGWIGSPSTSHYLLDLEPVFESLKKARFNVRFVAIGANQSDFSGNLIESWPWSEETEVQSIQKFDIGIMPLSDTPWERGKCGYKLIQYMACGLPVVASPVGVNHKIVKYGENGYLADTLDEWQSALGILLNNPVKGKQMGEKGRELVEAEYSLEVQAPRLKRLMQEALN